MSKRRVVTLAVLSGLGTLALPAAIVGVVLWISADIREVTHRFLGHVRAHRDDDAYAMASRELRSTVAEAAFSGYLDDNASIIRKSGSEWINGFMGGGDTNCVDVWLNGNGLMAETVYVLLVKEDGEWRVDRVTVEEIDECESSD